MILAYWIFASSNRFVRFFDDACGWPIDDAEVVWWKMADRAEDNLAATHRSLWFGSRPRPATGFFLYHAK
jgi:hypothetical protein